MQFAIAEDEEIGGNTYTAETMRDVVFQNKFYFFACSILYVELFANKEWCGLQALVKLS